VKIYSVSHFFYLEYLIRSHLSSDAFYIPTSQSIRNGLSFVLQHSDGAYYLQKKTLSHQNTRQLIESVHSQCLEVVRPNSLITAPCSIGNALQQWEFGKVMTIAYY